MTNSQQHFDRNQNHRDRESWLLSRTGLSTVLAIVVLGFLVYYGHSAHLLGILPYVLILSCPLMHVFMHGGHHGHQQGDHHNHQGHGGCHGGADNADAEQKSQGEK